MDANQALAERFEEHRVPLRAVAYRLLGSLNEAEDAVQEAWLRGGMPASASTAPSRGLGASDGVGSNSYRTDRHLTQNTSLGERGVRRQGLEPRTVAEESRRADRRPAATRRHRR
jgi:hypothetical protein